MPASSVFQPTVAANFGNAAISEAGSFGAPYGTSTQSLDLSSTAQNLLGPDLSNSLNSVPSLSGSDLSGLSRISPTAVSDFGTAAAQRINAQGQRIMQQGDVAEAGAYGNAVAAAQANEMLAGVSGAIQIAQEERTITQSLGGQKADIAAANLGDSGTAAFLARDTATQGGLQRQIIGTNTEIAKGGFRAQAAAATAEQTAANAAAGAAGYAASADDQLAQSATSAGNLAQALSLNNAAAPVNAPAGSSGGVRVINNGGTADKADQELGGTLNLDPTGAGLL